MPLFQIVVNQAGKPAGVAGQAREDLVTGVPVQLTITGGPFAAYFWSFIDKPVEYLPTPSYSSAGLLTPLLDATQCSPIDNQGTYLVQLIVDSGMGLGATPDDVQSITFYAGNTLNTVANMLPRRVPAFGEQTQHNVPDTILPGGLNFRGWAEELGRWFEVIKSATMGTSQAWARVHLTGAGATLVQGANIASVNRTGVGQVDFTFINPMSSANFGVVGSARGAVGGSVTGLNETMSGFSAARADPFGALADDDFTVAVFAT